MNPITTLFLAVVIVGGARVANANTNATDVRPSATVEAHKDTVSVTVIGVSLAANAPLRAYGDRVEIPLTKSVAFAVVAVRDATIKRIRYSNRRGANISLQLRHGRRTTQLMARAATVVAVPNGFRVTLPRKPRLTPPVQVAMHKPVSRPAPTLPAATTKTAVVAVPASKEVAAPAKPKPEIKKSPAIARMMPKALAKDSSGTGAGGMGSSMLIGFVLLSLSGGLIWWAKKRRPNNNNDNSLSVLASRSLGPKAKIVLVDAGEQELLLAVSDSGPRLLAQWKRRRKPRLDEYDDAIDDAFAGARSFAESSGPGAGDSFGEPSFQPLRRPAAGTSQIPRVHATSPAVAGIVSLRKDIPAVRADVATNDVDADAEWARELFLATKAGR